MKQPIIHLDEEVITSVHDAILETSIGRKGLHSEELLESLTGAILHKIKYEKLRSIPRIAAIYCFKITKGHAFVDGNKRTGFLVMYAFLHLNGLTLMRPDYSKKIEDMMVKIANNDFSEDQLTRWLIRNTVKHGKYHQDLKD